MSEMDDARRRERCADLVVLEVGRGGERGLSHVELYEALAVLVHDGPGETEAHGSGEVAGAHSLHT